MTPSSIVASVVAESGSTGGGAAPRSNVHVVALGGGTGLPIVLRGLREALFGSRPWDPERDQTRLSGIATVADDGGSSGKLRATYHLPAPGDVRNCLLAMAGGDAPLADVFNFRFERGSEFAGHSLGNLILTALTELEGDFAKAVARVGRLLAIRGQVLPSTAQNVTLQAELSDGTLIDGESRIPGVHGSIRRLRLQPSEARALPEAVEALERADLIVIGPGSLYSSLVAVLLVHGLPEAIARSRARVVLVMNLMTEPGETDRHTGVDHLIAVRRHAPTIPIHDVLVNVAPISPERLARYAARGAAPVTPDLSLLKALGHRVVESDLLAAGDSIKHDSGKLARTLLGQAR
jgi:uncharacterized cofD-like protein